MVRNRHANQTWRSETQQTAWEPIPHLIPNIWGRRRKMAQANERLLLQDPTDRGVPVRRHSRPRIRPNTRGDGRPWARSSKQRSGLWNKWGTQAGVGKNCAYEYLAGRRNLTNANRLALAEVLGLKTEDLPY